MELFELQEVNKTQKAKPFLKWAGGKSQLLSQFEAYYPKELKLGIIEDYFEPFLGGGAVFFNIIQKYNIKRAFLYDNNPELILVYKVLQQKRRDLVEILNEYKRKYLNHNETKREVFFYKIREKYNAKCHEVNFDKIDEVAVERAAQMLFLNKTCFNGLFRMNRRGEFNVPFGRYKNPGIIDDRNFKDVSNILENAEIQSEDFEILPDRVNEKSFVYLDPPYRPLNETSNFNSYSKVEFDDKEQIRLANTFRQLDKKGAKLMLSNSDPQNHNPKDHFFNELYNGFEINRVGANRMINCNGEKRGKINELLITNYSVNE